LAKTIFVERPILAALRPAHLQTRDGAATLASADTTTTGNRTAPDIAEKLDQLIQM
jgi:hypothetical protein